MIKKILLVSACLFATSCISNPIKYYPPKRTQTGPTKKESAIRPVTTTKLPEVTSSHQTSAQPNLSTSTPAANLPVPLAASVEVPISSTLANQQNLLMAVQNPTAHKTKVLELIDSETSVADLDKVIDQTNSVPQAQNFRPFLLLKAAELSEKNHRMDQALNYYRSLATQFPQSAQGLKANAEMALLQASQNVDSRVIGAILPLTGKNANIGQHALNSIRIGLGLNKADSRFRLAVFDSQGSAELAKLGVEKLLRDDRAIALIGGLSSKEALSAGQRANTLGVPFIGLSQKSGLTALGDFVFRNSLTAEMQVDRLVQYAFEKLGARRFAVLYPNDAYGVEFANIYWDHVLARGGQVTAAQVYDSKENDFTSVVQKLVGTYHVDARAEEYRERLKERELDKKEKSEKNKTKSTRTHDVQENLLPPIVDFDVIFIPDTGKTLGQVIAFMKVSDVLQMTYLGTNIWNSPDLGKRAGVHSNSVYFVDALDLNDATIRETPFFKDYFSEYNEEPTLIEMQTFESAKILRDLIVSGSTSRDTLASNLRSLGRATGVTGQLRMSTHRELERPLSILSLDAGQIKKLD